MDDERQGLLERVDVVNNYSATATQEEVEEEVFCSHGSKCDEEVSHRREKRLSVFCVHGSKWGVAQCCQDLGETTRSKVSLKSPKYFFLIFFIIFFNLFIISYTFYYC